MTSNKKQKRKQTTATAIPQRRTPTAEATATMITAATVVGALVPPYHDDSTVYQSNYQSVFQCGP